VMANYAFTDCTALETLTLGEGLQYLPQEAFCKCTSLSEIRFAENGALKEIGDRAFADCYALTELALPEGLELIGNNAFSMQLTEEYVGDETVITVNSKLRSVTIPQSVYSVGSNAFFGTEFYMDAFTANEPYIYADKWIIGASMEVKNTIEEISYDTWSADIYGIADGAMQGCEVLNEVYLPDSIKYVGRMAFMGNKKLSVFENSKNSLLESVGDYVFYGCDILQYIIFGPKVKSIGEGAFMGCVRLQNIEDNVLTPDSLTRLGKLAFEGTPLSTTYDEWGVAYAGNWVIGSNKEVAVTTITLRDSAVGICDYAFVDNRTLSTVVIPNTTKLKYIGRGAFARCFALDMVDLGATQIREIEDYTFFACTALSKIDLPMRLTKIGRSAFYNCMQLAEINLKGKLVTEIEMFAFRGCANLTAVDLGSSLETVGQGAFYDCVSLPKIDLPQSVTKIEPYTFFGCQSLKEITYGTNVDSIGEYAFTGCGSLSVISMSDAMKTIGDYAFYDCRSLTLVNFNSQLESIGDYAFFGAEKMISLTLPQSLKEVGRYAFSWNRQLPFVVISDSLTKVGDHAFYGCDAATFYMQSSKRGEGWSKWWNSSYRPIIWGCTLSEDGAYLVSVTIGEDTFGNDWTIAAIAEPYRLGYAFAGWATAPDGEAVYTAAEIVNAPVGATLYAVWTQE